MYRRILVPLDGSRFAEHALPHALNLASRWDASVDLTTVANPGGASRPPRGTDVVGDESRERAVEQAGEYLGGVGSRVREAGFEGEVKRTVIPPGNVSRALVRHLLEVDADFVVMTTHGRGPVERAWLGSCADGFIRRSPVPVLLVRPEEEGEGGGAPTEAALTPRPDPFLRVLFPLDGSTEAERLLGLAAPLTDPERTTCLLLRAVPPPLPVGSPYLPHAALERREHDRLADGAREYLEGLRERAPGADVEVLVPQEGEPARAILEAAREKEADLVAMSTAGRGGVARLLLGSVADKVIRGSPAPVLVYREPEDE